MPAACTGTDAAGYERALRTAPGDVRLPGGVPISACAWRARTDADLQSLGLTLHTVAERLAVRTREERDADAALQLGYLTGAVGAGADRSNGINAEIARRVGVTGAGLDELSPAVGRALRRGVEAGAARG